MNISISPANGLQTAAGADSSEVLAGAAETTSTPSLAKSGVDGQIRQLRQQGQTLSQISIDVDLSISAVGTDLLINVPRIPAITQTPVPSAGSSISLNA